MFTFSYVAGKYLILDQLGHAESAACGLGARSADKGTIRLLQARLLLLLSLAALNGGVRRRRLNHKLAHVTLDANNNK